MNADEEQQQRHRTDRIECPVVVVAESQVRDQQDDVGEERQDDMPDPIKTADKLTTAGVANALISFSVRGCLESAISVITTNMRPVSAAADEPTIT